MRDERGETEEKEWKKEQERQIRVRQTDGQTDREVESHVVWGIREEQQELLSAAEVRMFGGLFSLLEQNSIGKQCHFCQSIRINPFKCIHEFNLQWHKIYLFLVKTEDIW